MPQRKKAGCNSYASVSDDYTLYEKIMPVNSVAAPAAPVSTKGGVRRFRGGNDLSATPPTLASAVMDIANTNAFTQMGNLISATTGGSSRRSRGGNSCSASRRGGNGETTAPVQDNTTVIPNIVTDSVKGLASGVSGLFGSDNTSTGTDTKVGGNRRGGAIELAPFAASLAFLAARMSMDDKINFTKLLNLNQDEPEQVQEPEVVNKTSRSRRSRRSVAPVE